MKLLIKLACQIQKAGLEWIANARHFREVSLLNGLPYWLTGIFVYFYSYSEALQRENDQSNCMLKLRL